MPIYAYKCTKCEHEVEKIQKVDAPAPVCIDSEHGEMQKQLSCPKWRFNDPKGTDHGRLLR